MIDIFGYTFSALVLILAVPVLLVVMVIWYLVDLFVYRIWEDEYAEEE